MKPSLKPGIVSMANAALAVAFLSLLAALAAGPVQAQTFFHVVHTYAGTPDGAEPFGGLLLHDKALYGTTANGGDNIFPFGTVFKFTDPENLEVLYRFTGPDGMFPEGGVVVDKAGNLYGTTLNGGLQGDGVVYKLDTAGTETVLYSFTGASDGQNPIGNLVIDTQGNLYGTTQGGGDTGENCGAAGCGTVFEVNSAGGEFTLHDFAGGKDGAVPGLGGLVRDGSLNLYGVTTYGGADKAGDPLSTGTVFKLSQSGQEKPLYTFNPVDHKGDGGNPLSGLLRIAGNVFYGTTTSGGMGWGYVFKLVGGSQTILYTFTGGSDGAYPEGAMVTDGNFLYGTTYYGGNANGASGLGTVFMLSLGTNQLKVLHTFTGGRDGAHPVGPLLLQGLHDLYGTAMNGGRKGHGVLFHIGF